MIDEKFDICHIDGNKLNNFSTNFKYAYRKENILDKNIHGTLAHWRLEKMR